MEAPCRRNPRVTRWSPRASRDGEHHWCQAHQGDSGGAEIEGGARFEAPGPDQTRAALLASDLPHHPSSAKQHWVPLEGACDAAPEPQESAAAGDPGSPPDPHSPCGFPSLACLCRTPACRPPQCPPPCEQGQDWPGVAPVPGLTPLSCHLLPLAGDIWSLSPWFLITPV